MKKDLVIGIVGAAILIAAMVGVFRYEAARAGSAFAVEWADATVAGPSHEDTTTEGQQTEFTLNISQANLTKLNFTLTWTDSESQVPTGPDTFELTVVDPNGESQTLSSGTSPIVIAFDELNDKPLAPSVTGRDEAEAQAALATAYTKTAGQGTWSIIVKLTDAGDAAVPVPAGPAQDTSNAWALTVDQTVYEPRLTRA